jgi:3'-phosphoadenosine 5'-phosphosulfate sulfotransferase (PAPS reductase)/FAD synthetase
LELTFMKELAGSGYHTAIVFTDYEGGKKLTVVWVMVDNANSARATNNVIFDQAVELAKKYGAAESSEGRLRVELSDAPPGELIKDHIIESRDYNIENGG